MKLLDRLTEETIDTRQLASMGTITAQRYVLQEDWEYQGKKFRCFASISAVYETGLSASHR